MVKDKVKDVEKPKVPEQVKEQVKPRKEGQSTFDKVLERNRMMQKSPQQTQIKGQQTEHQETRVARHQEQGERGKDSQSDEKEQERSKQKAKEERQEGAEKEYRVAGKGRGKDSQGKGGGGKDSQGRGRGFGRPMHKRAIKTSKKGAFTKAAIAGSEAKKFAAQLKAQMKSAHLSKEFIQKLVNQIVKFVKTGLNKEGDKEVRLDLHERIFRGLQLRVAKKGDKVAVHFNTSNAEVRELFTGSSENIQKELEAKGISVHEIKVT